MIKDKDIIDTGKVIFGGSLLLGSICLFGYMLTRNEDFENAGFILLVLGSAVNLIVVFGLLVYGFCNKAKMEACVYTAITLLTLIPIAILYAVIGICIL
jgi:LIVCS family branched-chain amino acid:cation transporter